MLFALAQSFLFLGQARQADTWLRTLWKLREKGGVNDSSELFWMAAILLSDCAMRGGNRIEADTWLERAIESFPDTWVPYFLLGERKFLDGDIDRADELIRKAVEIGIGPTILPLDVDLTRRKAERYLSELKRASLPAPS